MTGTTPSTSLPQVAIDLGYGYVKYATANKQGLFRSIYSCCEHDNTLTVDVSDKTPLSFLYGDETPHGGRLYSLENDRLSSTPGLILGGAALWETGLQEGDIVLATGIPLETFAHEKDAVRDFWLDRTFHLNRAGESRTLHIADVKVYPQGYAALVATASDPELRQYLPSYNGLVALIDIGQRLTNVALVSVNPLLQFKASSSFTLVRGMNDAEFKIRKEIVRHYDLLGINLVPQDFLTTFLQTGQINYLEETVDFSEKRREILKYVSKRIAQEIKINWQSLEARVGHFLLAGGGSHYLNEYLSKYFTNVHLCESASLPAMMANVRGYQLLAQEER